MKEARGNVHVSTWNCLLYVHTFFSAKISNFKYLVKHLGENGDGSGGGWERKGSYSRVGLGLQVTVVGMLFPPEVRFGKIDVYGRGLERSL